MTSTPSDPSPSEESKPPAVSDAEAAAIWAEASKTFHEVVFEKKGNVRINALDHRFLPEQEHEADHGLGI